MDKATKSETIEVIRHYHKQCECWLFPESIKPCDTGTLLTELDHRQRVIMSQQKRMDRLGRAVQRVQRHIARRKADLRLAESRWCLALIAGTESDTDVINAVCLRYLELREGREELPEWIKPNA